MTDPARNQLPEPATDDIRLVTVLHALADPVRLRILLQLAEGHQDMACIAFDLPVSKSTSTHHFRVLREAGLIRQHRRGTARLSELRTADLEQALPGVLDRVLAAARAHACRPETVGAAAPSPAGDAPTME